MKKPVILVVSFGTSYAQSREATIGAVEQRIQAHFPAYEVRRAFTSGMILRKLRERDGIRIDNVKEAMERLAADGVDTVVIQPTHVMHGYEYDDMVADVEPYRGRFRKLVIGRPLLSSTEDYREVVRFVSRALPVPEDTALCLMGHGTEHFANAAYAALEDMFKISGHKNVFVGTVEGYPTVREAVTQIKRSGAKKVVLTPLMVVAGDHANNDMAGEEEDSWKSILEREGCQVSCILKGLGEYREIQEMYVSHVAQAMQN